jgi:hypothetical protein
MPVSNTTDMIAGMTPELCPGVFIFASLTDPATLAAALPEARALFHEAEGPSLIVPLAVGISLGLPVDMPMRQITLTVYSALDGIGLTAAVAGRLTQHGISCNVVAATHHDHIFVPEADGDAALAALIELQREAVDDV